MASFHWPSAPRWRPERDPSSATGGEPYLLTLTEDFADRTRRLHYLLPDGSRPVVNINMADDSPELRDDIGRGLAKGDRRYNPQRSNNQP